MYRTLLAASLIAALPASAAGESYTIDPNHTFPSYEILHFGYSLQRGRFNKTRGKVVVDAAARTGSADITIDTESIDTGHAKLEEHIRSADFLNAAQYPTIDFRGSAMAFEGENVKSVTGELTMLGVSRPVTLNASHFKCGAHPMTRKAMCGGEFVAIIRRSDWGIKRYIPALADEMTLRINVEAFRD
jgi:polyisoprenoid-binding protein YceI